ncbi:ARHGAP29 [Bugula neritina]|uniref:ARHGAP29 n=1 Tax=Bugula neritina TaxID=10212 RepID=A0A7J7JSF6_BUGNE|nr:ARHGAP29 [Bugula neritina]
MRRSLGVNDHGFSGTIDTQQMDQNTVLALTHDVRAFSDSLTKLHNVIYKRNELGESLRVTAHERLGEVLCILKTILKKYPPVNSTDLLTSTGILISRIKGLYITSQWDIIV